MLLARALPPLRIPRQHVRVLPRTFCTHEVARLTQMYQKLEARLESHSRYRTAFTVVFGASVCGLFVVTKGCWSWLEETLRQKSDPWTFAKFLSEASRKAFLHASECASSTASAWYNKRLLDLQLIETLPASAEVEPLRVKIGEVFRTYLFEDRHLQKANMALQEANKALEEANKSKSKEYEQAIQAVQTAIRREQDENEIREQEWKSRISQLEEEGQHRVEELDELRRLRAEHDSQRAREASNAVPGTLKGCLLGATAVTTIVVPLACLAAVARSGRKLRHRHRAAARELLQQRHQASEQQHKAEELSRQCEQLHQTVTKNLLERKELSERCRQREAQTKQLNHQVAELTKSCTERDARLDRSKQEAAAFQKQATQQEGEIQELRKNLQKQATQQEREIQELRKNLERQETLNNQLRQTEKESLCKINDLSKRCQQREAETQQLSRQAAELTKRCADLQKQLIYVQALLDRSKEKETQALALLLMSTAGCLTLVALRDGIVHPHDGVLFFFIAVMFPVLWPLMTITRWLT